MLIAVFPVLINVFNVIIMAVRNAHKIFYFIQVYVLINAQRASFSKMANVLDVLWAVKFVQAQLNVINAKSLTFLWTNNV